MDDVKASLSIYYYMIERRVDDLEETDPKLIYGDSWSFYDLDEVEAWSLAMIPVTHDIEFAFKFKKSTAFLKLTTMERVKEAETLDESVFIQLKCVTLGVLINPRDEYHFTLIISTHQISFTLSHFLESLESMPYRMEVKHFEAKMDKGEYKDRDGSPATGKHLCTKVNTLLQDFSIIKGKLEAQRLFTIPRTAERQTRVGGQSQGSLETATAGPSSTKAKLRPRSTSAGGGVQRSSPLASS